MVPSSPTILQRDGIAVLFGLEWFPLLGSETERQARSLARRRQASYRVVASGAAAAVGLCRGRLRHPGVRRFCSAAALFASLHPEGTVATILPLSDGRRWLVAVHEGAVMTRTDHLHDTSSSIDDTIRLLREAHPGLVLRDEWSNPADLLNALFEAAMLKGELIRTRSLAGGPAATLTLAALVIVLATGVAMRFTDMKAGPAPQPEDPSVAWRNAIAASAQSYVVHGVAGLQAVVESIHSAPAVLAGWRLAQVECRPRLSAWHCKARYRRGADADNHAFIDAALPAWTLSFDPMEGAEAEWTAHMPVLPLSSAGLMPSRQNEARLFSALQAMLPAFMELRLEAPQSVPVQAPRDAQRRPISRPIEITGYQRRPVRIQAPLRSLSLFLPETAHMSWDLIAVQITTVEQPTLRSSSLRVTLTGVLYEYEDPRPGVASYAGSRSPGVSRHGGSGPDGSRSGARTNHGT